MKQGGGKSKGSAFERVICKELSLWVSGGEHADLFWRSSMSGGRATIHVKKGGKNRQAGDICAVAAEGHALTDRFFIECKNYRNLAVGRFLVEGKGPLAGFWDQATAQAEAHGKEPLLIAKELRGPIFVVGRRFGMLSGYIYPPPRVTTRTLPGCGLWLLEDFTTRAWQALDPYNYPLVPQTFGLET